MEEENQLIESQGIDLGSEDSESNQESDDYTGMVFNNSLTFQLVLKVFIF